MKTTLKVTHPNGEVSTRKSDRPYTHAVEVKISTKRTLERLNRKMLGAVREHDAWQDLKNGQATVVITSAQYSNCVSSRVVITSNDPMGYVETVRTLTWDQMHRDWGNEIMRDDIPEEQREQIEAEHEAQVLEAVMVQVDRRVKSANAKIKKIQKEIDHVESLGGTTYTVNSWHTRYDLAVREIARYHGQAHHSRVVKIDAD